MSESFGAKINRDIREEHRGRKYGLTRDFSLIIELLSVALAKGKKFPEIKLVSPRGKVVELKLIKSGKNMGKINVTNGERYNSPESVWYGRIHENGSFEYNRRVLNTRNAADLVLEFVHDPAKFAKAHADRIADLQRWESVATLLANDDRAASQRLAACSIEQLASDMQIVGNCMFCGIDLSDQRSVSAGYGPICAGNYGLPWGEGRTKLEFAASE